MSNLILHATSRDRWLASSQSGVHLDPSLDAEGFIHCSTAAQVVRVANFLFRGQHGLVLLIVDPSRLTSAIKWEPPVHPGHEKGAPVEADLFPHIYGPINAAAVINVVDFEPGPDGLFSLPPSINRREPTMNPTTPTETAQYRVEHVGPTESWGDLVLQRAQGSTMKGKGFLGAKLGLTGMEISVNSMPPGQAYPFSHAHRKNEELYLFLTGTGEMMLDQDVVPVGPGTAIRVAPPVFRCWRNTGTVPLTCIVIQAQAGSLDGATAADGFLAAESPRWP